MCPSHHKISSKPKLRSVQSYNSQSSSTLPLITQKIQHKEIQRLNSIAHGRTYPHLAYQPIVLTVRVTDLLLNHSSLRSIPHHLHRTPQPLHLPNRPHLPQPRNRCLPRRPPQPLFTVEMYHKVRSATLPALLHHSPVLNRTVCFVLSSV